PYIDRNAYSGQYGKIASHKPRLFDLPSLRAIQTNVCIGRWQWCRYNAPPREKGGSSPAIWRSDDGHDTEPPPIRKKAC
ncbi:hypothetical protein, partial [Pseudomonas marginalis]|uniref:hypothetical protein n=1 Tax=Pseudomonas marginalis TaxID=298 RepID=UPI001C7EF708